MTDINVFKCLNEHQNEYSYYNDILQAALACRRDLEWQARRGKKWIPLLDVDMISSLIQPPCVQKCTNSQVLPIYGRYTASYLMQQSDYFLPPGTMCFILDQINKKPNELRQQTEAITPAMLDIVKKKEPNWPNLLSERLNDPKNIRDVESLLGHSTSLPARLGIQCRKPISAETFNTVHAFWCQARPNEDDLNLYSALNTASTLLMFESIESQDAKSGWLVPVLISSTRLVPASDGLLLRSGFNTNDSPSLIQTELYWHISRVLLGRYIDHHLAIDVCITLITKLQDIVRLYNLLFDHSRLHQGSSVPMHCDHEIEYYRDLLILKKEGFSCDWGTMFAPLAKANEFDRISRINIKHGIASNTMSDRVPSELQKHLRAYIHPEFDLKDRLERYVKQPHTGNGAVSQWFKLKLAENDGSFLCEIEDWAKLNSFDSFHTGQFEKIHSIRIVAQICALGKRIPMAIDSFTDETDAHTRYLGVSWSTISPIDDLWKESMKILQLFYEHDKRKIVSYTVYNELGEDSISEELSLRPVDNPLPSTILDDTAVSFILWHGPVALSVDKTPVSDGEQQETQMCLTLPFEKWENSGDDRCELLAQVISNTDLYRMNATQYESIIKHIMQKFVYSNEPQDQPNPKSKDFPVPSSGVPQKDTPLPHPVPNGAMHQINRPKQATEVNEIEV